MRPTILESFYIRHALSAKNVANDDISWSRIAKSFDNVVRQFIEMCTKSAITVSLIDAVTGLGFKSISDRRAPTLASSQFWWIEYAVIAEAEMQWYS